MHEIYIDTTNNTKFTNNGVYVVPDADNNPHTPPAVIKYIINPFIIRLIFIY